MTGRTWSASGRRPERGAARAPRPADSWSLAVARASEWWDQLTGHAAGEPYSDLAAAAILSTALGLWADTAASLAADRDG